MTDDAPSPPEGTAPPPPAPGAQAAPYRVLARAYRPTTFDGLVGQEALVRTLTNAFASGRLAQAYMLSGVRGIGKTTTARIIARALNCVGPDGTGGPTATPCGACQHCRAIAADNHVDVLEIDAASHTGVDDMRELIDGARYRPGMARYKVYIIDEVHMLSKSAFNALLKTLEEPPDHVRFVFATTEIRKVPVTVLSRCQRFDLRRVDAATLARHLASIVEREHAAVEPAALHLIARAADGSVRDGLSLLDQAIAHAAGPVDAATVRGMLGLADRTVVFDVFEAAMAGDARTALELVETQYLAGADPVVIVEDLLELAHWLTRLKVAPAAAADPGVPEAERVRGRENAEKLGIAEITRAWQLLLKGLGEVRMASAPIQAVEMLLVRLAYAARLPTPEEALRRLEDGGAAPTAAPPAAAPSAAQKTAAPSASAAPRTAAPRAQAPALTPRLESSSGGGGATAAQRQPAPRAESAPDTGPALPDFRAVVEFLARIGEMQLFAHMKSGVHLVRFEPGRIELRLADHVPRDVPGRLSRVLGEATGQPWLVGVSAAPGEATVLDQDAQAAAARKAEAEREPRVRAVLDAFPGATVDEVRLIAPPPPETEAETEPEADPEIGIGDEP